MKLTMREVKESSKNVIKLGYCEANALLSPLKRNGYTSGVYGWNSDIYYVGNVAISTGYRPFGNIRPDFVLTREYETKARAIRTKDINWEEMQQELLELLEEYISKVVNK